MANRQVGVRLENETIEELRKVAHGLGLISSRGPMKGIGSISALLELLAQAIREGRIHPGDLLRRPLPGMGPEARNG